MGMTGVSGPARGPAHDPDPGDHYRADGDAPVPEGDYRVVGRDADGVTLLHVGDGEGRRRHTGRVESVDRSDLPALETADAPGGGARARVGDAVQGLWLSARTVPGNLRERPVRSILAVALLAAAAADPAFLTVPPVAVRVANLLGAVLLWTAATGLPR